LGDEVVGHEMRGGEQALKVEVFWPSSAEEGTCVEDLDVNDSTVRRVRWILRKWNVRA